MGTADVHRIHEKNDVAHVEHVDDAAAKTVAEDGSGINFKGGTRG